MKKLVICIIAFALLAAPVAQARVPGEVIVDCWNADHTFLYDCTPPVAAEEKPPTPVYVPAPEPVVPAPTHRKAKRLGRPGRALWTAVPARGW